MIRKLFALVALFAFACGGVPEDTQDDQTLAAADQDVEIGQDTEALAAPAGPAGGAVTGYGFSAGTSRQHCNTTSTGQACFVPFGFGSSQPFHTVGYCFQGFTEAEKARIRTGISRVDFSTNWVYTETNFPCPLVIAPGAVSGGATCDSVDCYEKFSPGGTLTPLSESVPGSWTSFSAATCTIDEADVNTRAAALGTNGILMWEQLGGKCAGHMGGLGMRTDSFPGLGQLSVMDKSITPLTQHKGLTSGEVCLMNGFNANGIGFWGFSGSCPNE